MLQEALNLVIRKFSDSCGVVRCILDFYKTMSQAEEAYAGHICKLTKTGTQFRSTFIMKLLDMEPHQELQYGCTTACGTACNALRYQDILYVAMQC